MATNRILYSTQSGTVDGSNVLIQSASCENSIPLEDVMALGKLGPYTRAQKEVASCKADLKIYAQAGLGTLVSSLVSKATAGTQSAIIVTPNGFSMTGMLSNFSIDVAKGDFIMASMSFAGMGLATMGTTNLASETPTNGSPAAFTPITTDSVTVSGSPSCPTSLKFSYEIPTEIISCIGATVTGTQAQIIESNTMIGKVPYKGSITLEGLTLDTSQAGTTYSAFSIGTATGNDTALVSNNSVISVNITDAATVSRSFNQAAGDLGANYSFNVDGSTVTIS